jgi:aminopeptidase N/puromycin-sensitive aminopeptidase
MAHQWFGDLVTPVWWDNLWLNEGFATWMETKATGKWQPNWDYDQDVAQDKNTTMDEDASRTTRAIRAKAETPAEINAMFDDIAYGKAGAVIAMVENWVGEEVFRKGVQAYLTAHLYGSATAEDFWGTMTRVSGLPVDAVMRSYVDLPGVPEVSFGPDGAPGVRELRFFRSGTEAVGNDGWTIPVCFSGAPCRLLTPGTATMDVPARPLVYANAGDKGYYRTAYAPEQLKAIVASAETAPHATDRRSSGTPGLTAPERIGLLGDQWALMHAGQGTVGEFLDLALALKRDGNAPVLESVFNRIAAIESRIATDDDRERLEAVVRREFDPVYAALGAGDKHETYDHATLRETLFGGLGDAKDPAVLAEAEKVTRQLFAGEKASDPTLADAAVALTTVKGDEEMYERLMKVSREAPDPDLKEAARHALTRFQAPDLVKRTLDYAVSDGIRNQDSWLLIALLLDRRGTQDQAWSFVEKNWEAIQRKSTENSGARIVEAAGAFCKVETRDEVARFFREHPVESSERALAKSVESINDCIQLRAAQEPELRSWLEKQQRP